MKKWVFVIIGMFTLMALILGCSSIENLVNGNPLTKVKENLELGMGKAEVKKQFGRVYTSVGNGEDGSEVWRFDSVSDKTYTVSPDVGIDTGELFDRTGFQSGKLTSQLFVYWSKDHVVTDAVIYFVSDSDGEIHEYRMTQ